MAVTRYTNDPTRNPGSNPVVRTTHDPTAEQGGGGPPAGPPLRTMMGMGRVILLWLRAAVPLALTLALFTVTFEPGQGCRQDQAFISFTPPDVAKVLFIEDCGAIRCWSQWLQVDGKRVGVSRVCQDPERGRIDLVPELPPRPGS